MNGVGKQAERAGDIFEISLGRGPTSESLGEFFKFLAQITIGSPNLETHMFVCLNS